MPSQVASVRTVQEHSRLMVIDNVPLPPAASAVGKLAASVAAHRDDVGEVTLVVDSDPQPALENKAATVVTATTSRLEHPGCRDENRVCVIGPREVTRDRERVQPLVAVEGT